MIASSNFLLVSVNDFTHALIWSSCAWRREKRRRRLYGVDSITRIFGQTRRVQGYRSPPCSEGPVSASPLPSPQLIHAAKAAPDDSRGGDPDTSKLSFRPG